MSPHHAPYADGGAAFDIGLRPIEPTDWFEGGEDAPWLRKDALFAADPAKVWGELEGSRPGQAEAAAMVSAAAGGSMAQAFPPLLAAARVVADDLVLMERAEGDWRATAISLCSGTFFTADQALGKSLQALHAPAAPGFTSRLLDRTRRIFDHIPAGKIVQRRNWTLVSSGALHIPDPEPMRADIAAIDPASAGEKVLIRVERQTLRRLPITGGVLFTIRVWRYPLDHLREDPARLAAFADAWSKADPDFVSYKKLHLYKDLVDAFLRESGE
jgi:hypothetical protein